MVQKNNFLSAAISDFTFVKPARKSSSISCRKTSRRQHENEPVVCWADGSRITCCGWRGKWSPHSWCELIAGSTPPAVPTTPDSYQCHDNSHSSWSLPTPSTRLVPIAAPLTPTQQFTVTIVIILADHFQRLQHVLCPSLPRLHPPNSSQSQ